jgi:hypothetical protein
MGALVRSAFKFPRASSASGVQEKRSVFLKRRYKGRPLSSRREMKAAQIRKASHDPLYSFQVFDRSHVGDGRDFLQVGIDASLGNDEPQEHASGDSEDTFLGVEFHALRPQTLECRFKVREEVGGFPRLDYDVINVSLDRSADVLSEHVVHAPLVCRTCIFLKPNGIVI